MSQQLFEVDQETLKHIAQSLLEGKKMARSLESAANSLRHLCINDSAVEDLESIERSSNEAARLFERHYSLIAKDAFKKGDDPRED